MIGNKKTFSLALDGSLNNKLRHRGEADLARTVRYWKHLRIDLVIILDSGQGMALEFLARDLVLLGMPVHVIRLEELFADTPLRKLRHERILLLHAESSEELARSLRGDPVLDTPPAILRPSQITEQVEEEPQTGGNGHGKILAFPEKEEPSPASIIETVEEPRLKLSHPPAEPVIEAPTIDERPIPAAEGVAESVPKPVPKRSPTLHKSSDVGISRWNIRVKTIAILSALIVTSLGVMIFWASYQFTQDVGRQIESNMLKLNEVVGQKVQVILENTRYSADLIAAQGSQPGQMARNDGDLFHGNQDLLAILQTEPMGDTLRSLGSFKNREQMDLNGLIQEDLDKILSLYGQSLATARTGSTVVLNASPGFRQPLIVMSFPSQREVGRILVLVISARHIGESFLGDDSAQTFMVDRSGSIVAHPDSNMVLGGLKVNDLPVFQEMMKSPLDKQMVRYADKGKYIRGSFKKLPLAGLGVISTVEEDRAFAQVERIRDRNLMVLGIVLSLSALVGFFFARSLAIPLRELVGATRLVEAEDYTAYVEPRSRDEVGALAASFNKMVHGLAERERMKDAFGRFVNKDVAERAMRGEIKLGGEKKECAVFFSDLRGFTAMSEKMTPEDVVEYLNRYFTLMVDCVEKSHGSVDKFIGDAVMATWGSITSSDNDTVNAITGALMMRSALIEFNRYNTEHGRPFAKFGCGINTGEVISGQIGSEKRLEFTVIGDAVNLASRIESLNKPFATDILISADARERVGDLFDLVKMPAIKVKGKSEPQTIYAVLGKTDDPQRPKDLEELRRLTGIDWEAKENVGDVLEEEKEEKYEILEG